MGEGGCRACLMPEAYDLHEARFLQERQSFSDVNALSAQVGPVPAGKVWTILSANYYPDTAETKIVYFYILSKAALGYAITVPQSIALSAANSFPCLTEGMELRLYPGEYLCVHRDSAAAGSIMVLLVRYIESDLPYYSYEEPQNKIVRQAMRRGSQYRSSGGGISEGGSQAGSDKGEGGGGRGGPQPI